MKQSRVFSVILCVQVLVETLGVLDNFERALETKPTAENLAVYTKGIEMTQQELKNVLTKFGVTEVPSYGVQFDPSVHEALSSEETDSVKPGFISRVFKKPYKLFDKIIRPGQVIVAKEPVSN
jgi:molecular chaperone GrpE